jgi:hypothetical protein
MKQQLDLYRQLNTSLVPIQENSKAYDKLAWQERGYQSLADLKERGIKAPDILSWWGSGARKKRNVALVTTDHLLVLDFDTEDIYWRFCSTMPIWAQTMTIKSPHGYHCYYRTEQAIPSNLKSQWQDVEIKHSGDCILCPPSQIGRRWYHRIGIVEDPLVIPRAESIGFVEQGPVAQWLEHDSYKVEVPGSSPGGATDDIFLFTCANDVSHKANASLKASGERSLYKGIIQDIKERLSMLELAMRYTDMLPSGDGCFIGLCPAHEDTKPSFRVVGNRCGCFRQNCRLYDNRGLDIIEFHSRLFGLDCRGSIAELAEGLELI